MRTILILAGLFVLLLAAPILFAAVYYKARKASVLHINQDKTRDARYFGKSFSRMVRGHIDEAQGGTIQLSRQEEYVDADLTERYDGVTEHMVIARGRDFCPPPAEPLIFEKEIYSAKNAKVLAADTQLRALYAEEKAVVGDGVTIVRWADAGDTLAIYDNCDLGISCSAKNQLSIGHNCVFRRLYAPMIRAGQHPNRNLSPTEGRDMRIYYMPVEIDKENNVRYIHKEMINDDGTADFSVLSRHKVTVTEDLIIQGDIRSHKGVRVCDNAVVIGNIFAEKDVHLGRNATVLGNIFTQGSVYFDERASVGQWGKICSVVARDDIIFEKDNFVFGYVCCEGAGVTRGVTDEERELRGEAEPPDYQFLATPERLQHLRFKSLFDFQHVDWQGYRNEPELADAVIPAGALKIQKSMFFNCGALKKVDLPDSLVSIEDYAFADCGSLSGALDLRGMELLQIGTSAFENCREIPSVALPESLLELGGAAFAGCAALSRVTVPADGHLVRLGDHCFRDCVRLERIYLPAGVTYVGVSAFAGCLALREVSIAEGSRLAKVGSHCFRDCAGLEEIWLPDSVSTVGPGAFLGCTALRRVSVPETCARQPGIQELLERKVPVELRPLPPEAPADGPAEETEAAEL